MIEIVSTIPVQGDSHAATVGPVIVAFNLPVEFAEAMEASDGIRLIEPSGESVEVSTYISADGTSLLIFPVGDWRMYTGYELIVEQGVLRSGSNFNKSLSLQFTTGTGGQYNHLPVEARPESRGALLTWEAYPGADGYRIFKYLDDDIKEDYTMLREYRVSDIPPGSSVKIGIEAVFDGITIAKSEVDAESMPEWTEEMPDFQWEDITEYRDTVTIRLSWSPLPDVDHYRIRLNEVEIWDGTETELEWSDVPLDKYMYFTVEAWKGRGADYPFAVSYLEVYIKTS